MACGGGVTSGGFAGFSGLRRLHLTLGQSEAPTLAVHCIPEGPGPAAFCLSLCGSMGPRGPCSQKVGLYTISSSCFSCTSPVTY